MLSIFYSTHHTPLTLFFITIIIYYRFSSTPDYVSTVYYQITLPIKNVHLKKTYHNSLPLKFKGLLPSLFLGTAIKS